MWPQRIMYTISIVILLAECFTFGILYQPIKSFPNKRDHDPRKGIKTVLENGLRSCVPLLLRAIVTLGKLWVGDFIMMLEC